MTYKIMISPKTIGLFLIFLGTLLFHFEQRVYAHIDCFGPIYDVADNVCSFAGSILAPVSVDSHFDFDYRHYSRPWSNRRRQSRPFFVAVLATQNGTPLVLPTNEDDTGTTTFVTSH